MLVKRYFAFLLWQFRVNHVQLTITAVQLLNIRNFKLDR